MTRTLKPAMFAASFLALILAVACSSVEEDNGKSRDADARPAAAAVSPELLAKGAALYKTNCVACHGETGKGDGPAAGVLKPPPRDHTDRAYMSKLTDDEIAKTIKFGGAIKGKPLMPSHPQFKEEELRALVAHVRSLSEPNK
jgi:mono/diheme cytochrome c family protein